MSDLYFVFNGVLEYGEPAALAVLYKLCFLLGMYMDFNGGMFGPGTGRDTLAVAGNVLGMEMSRKNDVQP